MWADSRITLSVVSLSIELDFVVFIQISVKNTYYCE